MTTGVKDDDGGALTGTRTFAFGTGSTVPTLITSTDPISFETVENSAAFRFSGNGGIVSTLALVLTLGSKMAMITTGTVAAM